MPENPEIVKAVAIVRAVFGRGVRVAKKRRA